MSGVENKTFCWRKSDAFLSFLEQLGYALIASYSSC